MGRLTIEDVTIEFEDRGTGDPVVFIHGGLAEAFVPLLDEPALASHYRLVSYYRRGYEESTAPAGPLPITSQAADCRILMQHLRIERAHLVGHSYGGIVALQSALDAPHTVQSLALLEPAIPDILLESPEFGAAMSEVVRRYQEGDREGAMGVFLQGACGPDYREWLKRALPAGSFARAVAAIDTIIWADFPSLQEWRLSGEDAARIRQPVLSIVGSDSLPFFTAIDERVRSWLPQTETFILPEANHLLMVMNPRGMAEALAAFFARYPLAVPA